MRRLKLAMGFCFVVLLLAVPAMAEDDSTLGRKDFLNGIVISDERFSVLVIKGPLDFDKALDLVN